MRRTLMGIGRLVLAVLTTSAAVSSPDLTPVASEGQDGISLVSLTPDQFTERALISTERHIHLIELHGDLEVDLRVDQQDVDVSVRVLNPDGQEILDSGKGAGLRAARAFSFMTAASGEYRVEVTGAGVDAAGHYVLSMIAPRPPSSNERTLEEARVLAASSRSLLEQGQYDRALAPATRALELRESILGAEHALVADSLHLLADLHDKKGNYAAAEPVNLRALAIREKTVGPDHPDVARSLFNLAWIFLMRQDYTQAEAAYTRAIRIQERAFGPISRDLTTTLNDLAILHEKRGDYEKAIEIDQRVLAMRERLVGPSDGAVALTLNNLGLSYVKVGDYAKAEPCFTRALQIYESTRGTDHPDVATTSNNLGMLYENKGDYAAAERLHLRALAIDEAARGPAHENVAAYLNNLAWLYERQGDYAKADPLYRRALAIRESALGPQHSDVGEALNHLASVSLAARRGSDAEIEELLQRSLTIIQNALGAESEKLASPLSTLARLHDRQGDVGRAEPEYRRALAISEKTLGERHPKVAVLLGRLAMLYGAQGDREQALTYWQRYADVRETNIAHNLPIGSDRQKLTYLALFTDDVNNILSFHAQVAPHDPEALRLAFTTLLRRKGRALDEIADTMQTLRAHSDAGAQTLLTSLAESRARLATVTLRGPDRENPVAYRARVARLEATVDEVEANISARSAVFRAERRPATLDGVQAALPRDAALVEFARYQPTADPVRAPSPPRYSAYLLFGNEAPIWIDLGDADEIDRLVDGWRRALRDPRRVDVRRLAQAVDARILRPVRARLGDVRQLLVSPDGELHLIPFAALVDEYGNYLVEHYAITYLTSGRDLLRLQVPRTRGTAPVVFADPAFGEPAVVGTRGRPDSRVRVDYSQMFFGRLPGVVGEVQALRSLWPQAVFFTGADATKAALMTVNAPRLLHVATHGFFLENATENGEEARTFESTRLARKTAEHVQNPLLRSGLALAGANAGSNDGVLTALEAANLDLWGTQLVVLSACDTGVGEIRNGEGVYGLRRALVLAGSESQLISLWPVSDGGTRDLMIGFYAALLHGSGRGEALREIQLKMLRAGGIHVHPYYWASFGLSGQWSTIEHRQ